MINVLRGLMTMAGWGALAFIAIIVFSVIGSLLRGGV
jgi:hypothetical protein